MPHASASVQTEQPETEAPHPGVSSGGVEVEGVFADFAGQHLGIHRLSRCLAQSSHGGSGGAKGN